MTLFLSSLIALLTAFSNPNSGGALSGSPILGGSMHTNSGGALSGSTPSSGGALSGAVQGLLSGGALSG